MICHRCGKKITGKYYTFNSKHYCKECGVRCDVCGKKISKVYSENKIEVLCISCYKNKYAKRCSNCNKPLDKYVVIEGKNYCKDCYEKLFSIRCESCGKTISKYYEVSGKTYCKNCYKENFGKVCFGCGKKLLQYHEIDGHIYCGRCSNKEICVSCYLPIGQTGIKIDQNIYSCKNCYDNAVLTSKELKSIYNKIVGVLYKEYGLKLGDLDELKVTDINGIRRIKRWASKNIKGVYGSVNGKRIIYILRGLAREVVITVLTHEMAHFWQDKNGIRSDDEKFMEGFAEWLSFKIQQKLKLYKQMERAERNRYRTYSSGLKLFKNLENEIGEKGVFEYVKKYRNI